MRPWRRSKRSAGTLSLHIAKKLRYLKTGHFILTKKKLKEAVSAEDRRVMELAELPEEFDLDGALKALFCWCQSAFERIDRLGGI